MPITITDKIEKKSLLIGYKWNIKKDSLKEFAKKSSYGDEFMVIFFKNDLESDPYMTQMELGIDINQFKDNQVLLNSDPPASPVPENLILSFDEFYAYLAKVVKERIKESPEEKTEYKQLLAEVKTALNL